MTHPNPTRRAMTAIEVLVATLLASLMLSAVIGVLGGLSRQGRVLRNRSPAPSWQRQLIRQLRWDLANSREIVASPEGVRLVGYAGRDFVTDRPTGRPTAVDYLLVDAARDRWLVRREAHLDEYTNSNSRAAILARGVSRLQWGTVNVDRATTSPTRLSQAEAAERTVVPARTAIQIYGTDGAAPLVDEVFLLH